jgi:hypothetical protein
VDLADAEVLQYFLSRTLVQTYDVDAANVELLSPDAKVGRRPPKTNVYSEKFGQE